jgi:putative colanic acid biosynthesis acetyltransferase WcaF
MSGSGGESRVSSVRLAEFDNSWYEPGRGLLIRTAWFYFGLPVLRCAVLPSSAFRCVLLRGFGAKIGRNVVIKPGTRVKYPWRLSIGNDSWIGEDCWIDNLAEVSIGNDVCVSQAAYLCTGNHNRSDPAFGLIVKPITLRDGSWVGARATVCPGVEFGEGAIATAGSVVSRSIAPWEIHTGNPASFVKRRVLETKPPARH